MGVYTQNIHNLSLNDLVRNLENIEGAIATKKAQIQRIEKRNKNPLFAQKYGIAALASLNESLTIWENKHDVNNRALSALCDAAWEDNQQLKREGKWDCEEQPNEEEG